MKKRVILALSAATLILAVLALRPAPKTLCEGFLPPNNMKIPIGDVRALGIKEDVFNRVMDKAAAVYAPIIASRGGTLKVNRLWSNPTVNASAEQRGSTWIINMYGGLARHAAVTEEGFALVVCHELGHHLGGYPRYSDDPWASNEGQSDYFAVAKCLRKAYPLAKTPAGVDPVAAKRCESAFPAGAERNSCLSNALGGMSVAKLFQDLMGASVPPKFDTPDTSEVAQTDDSHPDTQCRLDTYFQGALCAKSQNEDFSTTDGVKGACTASQGFKEGFRPRCWYKPADGEAAPAALARRSEAMPEEKAMSEKLEALRGALSGGR